MIKSFIKYGKFKEYFSIEFETVFAAISTIILLIFAIVFRMWDSFKAYEDEICSLIGSWIAALIGSLALIFSGIVFWGSLFDDKYEERLIRYTKKKDVVDRFYSSYLFLAFNIACNGVVSLLIVMAIRSNLSVIHRVLFYCLSSLYLYWSLFVIGYFVSIMKNCIDLIRIKREKGSEGKTIFDKANELRIDVILELLYRNMSAEDTKSNLLEILKNRVDESDYPKEIKDKLNAYFENYYSLDQLNPLEKDGK